METATPTAPLPLVSLPRAVPEMPNRPPQETIPQTRGERELILRQVKAYVAEAGGRSDAAARARRVAPAGRSAHRAARDRLEVRRLRRHRPEQRGVARAAFDGSLRPAAAADAQVPAGRGPVPGAVRRVRPALQAVRPLLHPGSPGRSRAPRLCRAGGGGIGPRHGVDPDRQDRGYRRRKLHLGTGAGLPLHGVGGDSGRRDPVAAGRLQGHGGRRRVGLGTSSIRPATTGRGASISMPCARTSRAGSSRRRSMRCSAARPPARPRPSPAPS